MKTIPYQTVVERVREICMSANFQLSEDVIRAVKTARSREPSPTGGEILDQILENADIAAREKIGLCQDTGVAVFFVERGEDVHIEGGTLTDAINEGVRRGYQSGYLRKSLCHPFTRRNTEDNTPAVIHYDLVSGDGLKIIIAPKGGGSENMSRVVMLQPADGRDGVIDYVVQRVKESGANPCPPIIVGVGIGGTFEQAALIAKKALLRKVGSQHIDPDLAEMEQTMLRRINRLGIGPQGLGGRTTALAVHIEMMPCHIASLPLAVNINCHATRHAEIVF